MAHPHLLSVSQRQRSRELIGERHYTQPAKMRIYGLVSYDRGYTHQGFAYLALTAYIAIERYGGNWPLWCCCLVVISSRMWYGLPCMRAKNVLSSASGKVDVG